jgi:hypothetical protein
MSATVIPAQAGIQNALGGSDVTSRRSRQLSVSAAGFGFASASPRLRGDDAGRIVQ